jgi:hypothetical protein
MSTFPFGPGAIKVHDFSTDELYKCSSSLRNGTCILPTIGEDGRSLIAEKTPVSKGPKTPPAEDLQVPE